MRRFHVTSHLAVPLARRFADELPIPHKPVPVKFASFVDHCFSFRKIVANIFTSIWNLSVNSAKVFGPTSSRG